MSCPADVLLQLVRHVQRRRVGRDIEIGTDAESIDRSTGCKHALDAVLVQAAAQDDLQFPAAPEVEDLPHGQRLLEVQRIKDALAHGHSVIIFPEGTFTSVTGLRSFHLGAFEIAAATGTPVIPLTLRGTRSVLRDGQRLLRRLPVEAVIGNPLLASAHGDVFAVAVQLRSAARTQVLRHCGEPDLG